MDNESTFDTHPDDRNPEYCIDCGRELTGDELNYRACFECFNPHTDDPVAKLNAMALEAAGGPGWWRG